MGFKTGIQLLMGAAGFGIWTFMAYNDPALQKDYLTFVQGVVVGISALALRDMHSQPNETKKEEEKQS